MGHASAPERRQNERVRRWPSLVLPDPPLVDGSARLRAWRPTAQDAAALAAAWTDAEIARWSQPPPDHSVAAATAWIAGQAARRRAGLALDLVVTGCDEPDEVWGEIGLAQFDARRRVAEIGFWTAGGHRLSGVATRAVTLVAAWALGPSLGLDGVVARTAAGNRAAAATLERAGFKALGRAPASAVDVWLQTAGHPG